MTTIHIILHSDPLPDIDASSASYTLPIEGEADYTIHIMASSAIPDPETSTTPPSTLSKISTAAPVLVTAGSVPGGGTVDDHQTTSITPVTAQVDKGKAVKIRSPDEELTDEPTAEIAGQLSESTESEPSPTIVVIEENYGPIAPLGEEVSTQEQSTVLLNTRDYNAKGTQLHDIVLSSVGKPYQNGIQVPSHVRLAEGFPYPPGLAAYEIPEEDWHNFTTDLTTLISPHGGWLKSLPIRLVPPFGVRDEKRDFQKSLSKVFEYVRKSQNNIFRPKGLLMRVDVPGDGVGMEFMDLYHRRHVDHLTNIPGTEAVKKNTACPVVSGATANVAKQPVQSDKAEKDKTLENARKEQKRTLNHLNSAQKKMSKRIRVVMEPVTVLDDAERAERNGWTTWIRHCDNYGSQLAT